MRHGDTDPGTGRLGQSDDLIDNEDGTYTWKGKTYSENHARYLLSMATANRGRSSAERAGGDAGDHLTEWLHRLTYLLTTMGFSPSETAHWSIDRYWIFDSQRKSRQSARADRIRESVSQAENEKKSHTIRFNVPLEEGDF